MVERVEIALMVKGAGVEKVHGRNIAYFLHDCFR